MDFVFAVCNGCVLESYSSEAWTQPAIESEILKRIRQICDEIRVLQERKLNLSCTALQPVGILAQWLFKKYNISGNNLMGDTISSVWQGISEEARLQLYCESLRQTEKVKQQASQIEIDAEKLRVESKCLTEKLPPREKDKSVCQYFQGDIIEGQKMEYFCMEAGCGKSFKTRGSFYKHRSRNHPWMMMPSVSVAAITIASPVVLPAVVSSVSVPLPVFPSEPVIPLKCGSVSLPTGKPRIGLYKRPVPKDIVDSVPAKVFKIPLMQPKGTSFNGFPSDAHYRANEAYRTKTGRDRPNGRNVTLVCDCPAVLNVVTHEANHILNRGADYFWCSRKAIKKIGQSVNDLSSKQNLLLHRKQFLPPNDLHPQCLPIELYEGDPNFIASGDTCMSFTRSKVDVDLSCTFGQAEQLNSNTHYLDGSQIYGSDATILNDLRTGIDGLLKSSDVGGSQLFPIIPGCENVINHELVICFQAVWLNTAITSLLCRFLNLEMKI
ncbi:Uncharacterized protein APZ42_025077 [Daphnia magna]|uniref:C2H2-type domain-containing protein n=1 Tax=Daphnia magna TaxID=35525 RepID=A0A164THC0_9CRUS|nr:Uncharacterized protein APZ42_025077 [Daphnia magna]